MTGLPAPPYSHPTDCQNAVSTRVELLRYLLERLVRFVGPDLEHRPGMASATSLP